jgi:hypothetical protein
MFLREMQLAKPEGSAFAMNKIAANAGATGAKSPKGL